MSNVLDKIGKKKIVSLIGLPKLLLDVNTQVDGIKTSTNCNPTSNNTAIVQPQRTKSGNISSGTN